MKIAFIFNENKLSGKLTNFFTGCYCYHVGFVDEDRDIFYDMNLLRRKRRWSVYRAHVAQAILIECPVTISADYLEEQLLEDCNWYGVFDYALFALRPLYHALGKSTRNAGGVICSEMVYDDLVANGWHVVLPEVPSPCALYNLLG
jgi:hypothetical protein